MRKVLYILGLLTDADIAWMARIGVRRRLSDGEVVLVEGGSADALILVLEGEVLVSADGYGDFARLGVGEIVGEISLVDSAPPSATITAQGEGLALFIDRASLMAKLDHDVGFSARFYRALAMFLADRLRATRMPRATSLADVAAVSPDELDIGIMENVSEAGERFNRMLRILSTGP